MTLEVHGLHKTTTHLSFPLAWIDRSGKAFVYRLGLEVKLKISYRFCQLHRHTILQECDKSLTFFKFQTTKLLQNIHNLT